MATITREVYGLELKITLTEEEIRNVIAEHATIAFKPVVAVPTQEPETKTYTMPKTTHVGRLVDHMTEVRDMVEQDYPYTKIAEYFGVSISTVNKYVKMWGLQRPGALQNHHKGLSMLDARAMLEAKRNGTTYRDIAKAYGVKEEVVSYWVNKAKAAEGTAA